MGFMTPALLAGAALVAVPIILHLVMRRQPRRLEFPALQFVRSRQQANRRRLNFRHWLLLALRCALIAGFALALARPTFKSHGQRGRAGAPLAMALVLDNSLRMQYIHENQTRQQAAVDMAQSLLSQLTDETELAIVDLGRARSGFVVDLGTAESRLRNLAPESNPRPLEDAVREAIELMADRPDHRQEIFLFSDLNATSWNDLALVSINDALAEAPDVRLYLVDVGVDEPRNLSLGALGLRRNTLRPGEPLRLTVPLEVTRSAEAPLVELYLEDSAKQAVKRGQRIVEVDAEGAGQATFELGKLALGSHQGFVRLAASDPLEVDNTRYFTVEVRPAAKVLLLGEKPRDTLFLREALSPSSLADRISARFECRVDRFANAANVELREYDAVCLLDPPPLSDHLWDLLVSYADEGGGVGIFLGERAQAAAYNSGAALRLLPGALLRKSRYETFFRPERFDHPALAGLRDYAESIPWQAYSVFRYWEFDDLTGDAYVIARFANNEAALVERPFGPGRVVTFATTISDPPELEHREPWNLLPAGPWPFVALCNQIVGYLAKNENESLAFLAGETVSLPLSPSERVSSFVLHPPEGESLRRTLPPGADAIRIGTTRELGNYRIASGGASAPLQLGFSVNAAPKLSRLDRVDRAKLAAALPADQVEFASTLADIERYVDIGRSGRELFPWAITLVALVWGAEHLLSNRFYRSAP